MNMEDIMWGMRVIVTEPNLPGGQHEVTTPTPEPVESLSGAPSVTSNSGEESAESPAASLTQMKTELINHQQEQPTTRFVMFSIIVIGFFATVLHAVTDTWWQRVALFFILGPIAVAFLGLVKRTHREDEERFNRQMNGGHKS